jgi:hypothetical protein
MYQVPLVLAVLVGVKRPSEGMDQVVLDMPQTLPVAAWGLDMYQVPLVLAVLAVLARVQVVLDIRQVFQAVVLGSLDMGLGSGAVLARVLDLALGVQVEEGVLGLRSASEVRLVG